MRAWLRRRAERADDKRRLDDMVQRYQVFIRLRDMEAGSSSIRAHYSREAAIVLDQLSLHLDATAWR